MSDVVAPLKRGRLGRQRRRGQIWVVLYRWIPGRDYRHTLRVEGPRAACPIASAQDLEVIGRKTVPGVTPHGWLRCAAELGLDRCSPGIRSGGRAIERLRGVGVEHPERHVLFDAHFGRLESVGTVLLVAR